MAYDFTERHVVVTGGTGALGTQVTRMLMDSGATVHIPAIDEREIEQFPLAEGENIHLARDVDLTNEDQVRDYFAGLPTPWASIHCAGGFGMGPVTETGADELHKLINLNIVTSYLCTREAVRVMQGSGAGGRIVNVSAQPGIEPRNAGGFSAYSATKAAVAAMTMSIGSEVKEDGIWVNAIAPSIIDTPANREAMPDADHAAWPSVTDVAATILFLASTANHVTRSGVVPVYGHS